MFGRSVSAARLEIIFQPIWDGHEILNNYDFVLRGDRQRYLAVYIQDKFHPDLKKEQVLLRFLRHNALEFWNAVLI